jgi:hypothetical protein
MAVAWGNWETITWWFVKKTDRSVTLNGDLTAATTTINITGDNSGYASAGYLEIDNENISYTGKTATSFTGCTRGHNNTLAATHSSGATVYDMVRSTRSGTTADLFPDNADVGDALYFLVTGNASWGVIKGLRANVGTARDGTATLVYEYPYYTSSSDRGWEDLPTVTDNTNGFSTTGSNDITWNNSSIDTAKPWIAVSPGAFGGTAGRIVRIKISAVSSAITQGGAIQTSAMQGDRDCIFLSSSTEASPDQITDIYAADVAGGWGIVGRTGNSSFYDYELKRPIYIDSGAAFKALACQINLNVEFLQGSTEVIVFESATTSFFTLGALTSDNHSVNETSLTMKYGHIIVGPASCGGWKQYGGIMRSGTFVTMGPKVQHETTWLDGNYFSPVTDQVIRDVRVYRVGDGYLAFSSASTVTKATKGLKFNNGITVDSIQEKTAENGVLVDTIILKDKIIYYLG